MDPQNILLIIIVILAVILLVLGIQAFLVLKAIRSTVSKANKVLDETGLIAQNFSGVSLLANLVKSLVTKKDRQVLEPKTARTLEVKTSVRRPSRPARRLFRGIRRP
jgi:hypothetical protein